MAEALIFGRVVDRYNLKGLEGILVALNDVTSASGAPIRIQGSAGSPMLRMVTNARGEFLFSFQWDATLLGNAMDGAPSYRLNLHCQLRQDGRPVAKLMTRHRGEMTRVVSLGAVASGRVQDLRSLATDPGFVIQEAVRLRRGFTLPMPTSMYLNPGLPSPEYYALLAAAEISVVPPVGRMNW